MKTKFIILFCFLIALSSCAANVNQTKTKPDWIYKPSTDKYIGGVGIAKTHINGKSAQRELASLRALEDIARQMGIKIDNVMSIESRDNRTSSSTNINSYSIHSVSGQTVTAKIYEIWEDSSSGEIYIYMRVAE